ncbi:MAG: elongation factor 1-beta [Candidatus Aenigmarchaeota archaeon]|nr:elongation factor 1-beta [Candidatus Aenigmarchaeota archaeon]MCX8190743.1 elongation factor 1-beta [Candidatus Aenigmarchaeota archaeon]MDW8159991.1 elongation factor 1-beta [Candidatus Aenigmarchaeota archaeon]
MAKVVLTLKVFPSDVSVDLKELKKRIEEKLGSITIKEEPIAFGLTSLILNILIEDKEGEVERIENLLKKINGVGELEVIELTRAL